MYNFKQNNGALEYIRMGGRGVGDSLSDVRQRSSQWHPPPLGSCTTSCRPVSNEDLTESHSFPVHEKAPRVDLRSSLTLGEVSVG